MAISRAYLGGVGIANSGHTTIASNTSGNAWYTDSAQAHYYEQERRYREEMERQRMMAMQNVYDFNTDTYRGMSAQQMQEVQPAKKVGKVEPDYLSNQKLLLLGEAS